MMNPRLSHVRDEQLPVGTSPIQDQLVGIELPHIGLPSTELGIINLGSLRGKTIIYIYPGTEEHTEVSDSASQACSFRLKHAEFMAVGVDRIFGLSTQAPDDQYESANRLHLPYALLSDCAWDFAKTMHLPTLQRGASQSLRRITLVAVDGTIKKVFYPIPRPDKNAEDVLTWLKTTKACAEEV